MSNKVFKSYREESRVNWGTNIDEKENISSEQISLGALLRIADASEAMAKNHLTLQDNYNFMKERRDYYRELSEKQERQIRALKGVITKLKRKGGIK